MPLYIKFDNLEGDVTHKQYAKHSALSSLRLPVITTGVHTKTGNTDHHNGGAPSFANIQIIKPVDSITPNLFAAASNNKVFKEVTIVDTGVGNGESTPFLVTTLKNVRIAAYSMSQYGDGFTPREMISLTYSSIAKRLTGKNANGSLKASKAVGYDLSQMTAL